MGWRRWRSSRRSTCEAHKHGCVDAYAARACRSVFTEACGHLLYRNQEVAQWPISAIVAGLRRRQVFLLATVSESSLVGEPGASNGQKSAGLP